MVLQNQLLRLPQHVMRQKSQFPNVWQRLYYCAEKPDMESPFILTHCGKRSQSAYNVHLSTIFSCYFGLSLSSFLYLFFPLLPNFNCTLFRIEAYLFFFCLFVENQVNLQCCIHNNKQINNNLSWTVCIGKVLDPIVENKYPATVLNHLFIWSYFYQPKGL